MKYTEAKEELIQAWGNLGYSWGLNKTMAQIHALLMISPKPIVNGRNHAGTEHFARKCQHEYQGAAGLADHLPGIGFG